MQADLVREFGLFQELAQHLGVRDGMAVREDPDVAAMSPVPVAAYQISGEYSMIEAAAANGWIDRRAAITESVLGIKRAGANMVLTYWASELAGWLKETR